MIKSFILRDLNIKRNAIAFVANLPVDERTPLVVTIKEMTRSLDANAALWRLLQCFADQQEWPVNGSMVKIDSEAWKDILSAAFRQETPRVAMGLNGGMVMLGQRTSKMGKKEFSEFLEFIQSVAAERGINCDE